MPLVVKGQMYSKFHDWYTFKYAHTGAGGTGEPQEDITAFTDRYLPWSLSSRSS